MSYAKMTIGQLEVAKMRAEKHGLTAVATTIYEHLVTQRYPAGK